MSVSEITTICGTKPAELYLFGGAGEVRGEAKGRLVGESAPCRGIYFRTGGGGAMEEYMVRALPPVGVPSCGGTSKPRRDTPLPPLHPLPSLFPFTTTTNSTRPGGGGVGGAGRCLGLGACISPVEAMQPPDENRHHLPKDSHQEAERTPRAQQHATQI
eukprot:scaffold18367_cov85-Isochrysis_galbana.AAC.1